MLTQVVQRWVMLNEGPGFDPRLSSPGFLVPSELAVPDPVAEQLRVDAGGVVAVVLGLKRKASHQDP